MAAKKTNKPGKPLTQAQRDAVDEKLFADGGFEIIRKGKRLRMNAQGNFVPVTGTQAQQVIKKQRKSKKKSTGKSK